MEPPNGKGEELKSQLSKVILTFDTEGLPPNQDSFDDVSAIYLRKTLDLLDERNFEGIFFLTGTVAKQIRSHPDIVKRLCSHEIGYHSSSHRRPTIPEYTDVASYEEAMSISLKRETSPPCSDNVHLKDEGGILSLRKTFPKKDIECFRAPFLAWSPPHLEAVKHLGLQFDFSSGISNDAVSYRGIGFYPYPIPVDGVVRTLVHKGLGDVYVQPLTATLLRRRVTVLSMHPSNVPMTNPFARPDKIKVGGEVRAKLVISFLRLLLGIIHALQEINVIEVTSSLTQEWQPLRPERTDVERAYRVSIQEVARLFGCNPRFVLSHFMHFFGQD